MSVPNAQKDYDLEEPLTSNATPLTSVTLTIRVIKSFPYRNVKNFVLRDYNLKENTGHDLFEDALKHIQTEGAFRPFRNVNYDTMKIYTHAHGSKTVNLVINFEHDDDDWVIDVKDPKGKKLSEYDVENETEISLYNLEDYVKFKANPEEKW
ncbi:altered inheritance rate of mitochondria protein 29 [Monosporozyma unispora]|nr:Altered inheritance rate of mitochondria protein 29 [Kazachstania unispora]